jgi:hypothetical protein
MIMELDHSHRRGKGGSGRYAELSARRRVMFRGDRVLRSHTQNMLDNSDTKPEAEAIMPLGKTG